MKPKSIKHTPQRDAFRPELRDIIDPRHELIQLSNHIDWDACEAEFSQLYADLGRPGSSIRLLVGMNLIKHTYALSDEDVVQRWVENPYMQFFCGEQYFQHEPPIDPTTLGRFRRRLGEPGMKQLLSLTVQAGLSTGTIEQDSLKTVAVDTTVLEKAIHHPTDGFLLKRAQEHLVKLAKSYGIKLRQTYEKELKKLALKVGRYAHAKQFRRMRRDLKKMARRVGRLVRDILRNLPPEHSDESVVIKLKQAATVMAQATNPKTKAADKLFSLHAPEVACIAKGKSRKPYEFGCKVSVVSTAKEQFVLCCRAEHGNPYDGHTLEQSLRSAAVISGQQPHHALVDRGYKGAENSQISEVHITGRRRGKGRAHQQQNRRNAIEAIIGHMKTDGLMDRNYLKGTKGDRIHAVLCGVGQNLRMILKKLRELLFWLILYPGKIALFWADLMKIWTRLLRLNASA